MQSASSLVVGHEVPNVQACKYLGLGNRLVRQAWIHYMKDRKFFRAYRAIRGWREPGIGDALNALRW
jgi:hypothetical protein